MATNFNLNSALNGNSVVTRNGNRVVILSVASNGKVIANVYNANKLSNIPTMVKYNQDGTLYGPTYNHPMDLVMAA